MSRDEITLNLLEQMRLQLTADGVSVREPCEDNQILKLEQQLGGPLPEDFKAYLRTMDGAVQGSIDSEYIEWWSLDRMGNVPEVLGSPTREAIPHAEDYFVFADWFTSAHHYAICLDSTRPEFGSIIWIMHNQWCTVACSFTGFVRRYLKDPSSIVWPSGLRATTMRPTEGES